MKYIIRLEEAALFAASMIALYHLGADGWFYLVLFLGPDISMIGYLGGNAVGAACYNFLHHKGIAAAFIIGGLLMPNELLLIIGVILFGHSSMDRMFGYGLKFEKGFKYTHLGTIGKYKK